jgi:hypothetical protein
MMRLEFLDAELHEGENITVRKGLKWANATGEEVEVYEVYKWQNGGGINHALDKYIGRAVITSVLVDRFDAMMDNNSIHQLEILTKEHSSKCRTVKGLREAMISAYPDFKDSDEVCAVTFVWPTSWRGVEQ